MKLYKYSLVAFATFTLLSNILAIKIIPIGPFVYTAGIIIFPLSYILGDILTEVYGYRGAQRAFLVGIVVNVFASVVFWVAVRLPGINPEVSEAFALILNQVPRIVIASILGLWAGQHANAAALSWVKVRTRGRWLWVRTISSTLVGETIDTAVFVTVAFGGILPFPVLLTMVWSASIFKTAYEAAATPITYAVVTFWKKIEGLDTFDYNEDYNPLVLRGGNYD